MNIAQGDSFTRSMTITPEIMEKFKQISGDENPIHTDSGFANRMGFRDRVVYGNLLGLLVSSLVGMELKTLEVMIASQTIHFKKPVYINDTVILEAVVVNKSDTVELAEFSLDFKTQNNITVATGKLQAKYLSGS